jgi:hypothetical protein
MVLLFFLKLVKSVRGSPLYRHTVDSVVSCVVRGTIDLKSVVV